MDIYPSSAQPHCKSNSLLSKGKYAALKLESAIWCLMYGTFTIKAHTRPDILTRPLLKDLNQYWVSIQNTKWLNTTPYYSPSILSKA